MLVWDSRSTPYLSSSLRIEPTPIRISKTSSWQSPFFNNRCNYWSRPSKTIICQVSRISTESSTLRMSKSGTSKPRMRIWPSELRSCWPNSRVSKKGSTMSECCWSKKISTSGMQPPNKSKGWIPSYNLEWRALQTWSGIQRMASMSKVAECNMNPITNLNLVLIPASVSQEDTRNWFWEKGHLPLGSSILQSR